MIKAMPCKKCKFGDICMYREEFALIEKYIENGVEEGKISFGFSPLSLHLKCSKYREPKAYRGGEPSPLSFICPNCKHNFVANLNEYNTEDNFWEEGNRGSITEYYIPCPECDKRATLSVREAALQRQARQ